MGLSSVDAAEPMGTGLVRSEGECAAEQYCYGRMVSGKMTGRGA